MLVPIYIPILMMLWLIDLLLSSRNPSGWLGKKEHDISINRGRDRRMSVGREGDFGIMENNHLLFKTGVTCTKSQKQKKCNIQA